MRIQLTVATISVAASFAAHADYCAHIEFAELQSMTIAEIRELRADVLVNILNSFDNDLRLSEADKSGCRNEEKRLDRIIAKRESAQSAAVTSTPNP